MSEEFKPITTQDELNSIIENRLKRERDSANKRFEGWISPEDHQRALNDASKALDDYKKAHEGDEQKIADLEAKNKAYETDSLKNRIAHEIGLGYEWISRISGTDEESIRADAESLKKLVGNRNPIPTKSTETDKNLSPIDNAYRKVLSGISKS